MKLIFRVLIAISLGLIIACYYVQQDARFLSIAEKKLEYFFQHTFECCVHYTLKKFNVVPFRLHAEQIAVTPRGDTHDARNVLWHWQAQSVFFSSSLLRALLNRRMSLDIVLHDVHAYSTLHQGTIAIAEHLKKLIFEVKDLPFALRSLVIRKGSFSLSDPINMLEGLWKFSSESTLDTHYLKTALYVTDGTLSLWNMPLIHTIAAQLHLKKSIKEDKTILQAEGQCIVAPLSVGHQDCYSSMQSSDTSGSLSIHTKTNSLVSTVTFNTEQQSIDINGHIALECLDTSARGTCVFDIHINTSTKDMQGTLTIDSLSYNGYSLGSLEVLFQKHNALYTAQCTSNFNTIGAMHSVLQWHEQKNTGHIDCWNDSPLDTGISYWKILPHDLQVHSDFTLRYDDQESSLRASGNRVCGPSMLSDFALAKSYRSMHPLVSGNGTFSCRATHAKLHSNATIKGSFSFDNNILTIAGALDSYSFQAQINLVPTIHLNRLTIRDTDSVPVHIQATADHQALEGTIAYSFVRSCLEKITNLKIPGEGVLHVKASMHDSAIKGTIHMQKAHIKIPEMYNSIHAFDADLLLDIIRKKLVARNVIITLHKGVLASKRATIRWNDAQELYMHIPLVVEKLFMNKEKDVFAEISGSLLFQKEYEHEPLCRGVLAIDHGQSKKNIFALSSAALPDMAGLKNVGNLDCDIAIKTKKPFRIQTAFLKTEARVSLVLKNTNNNPHLAGTISLSSGVLKFPYRDLYITKGSLYFLPYQLDDPLLELVAKGVIKHYHITMTLSGSLQNPHLSFESSPSLQEEQIITLLLAGSQEGSLALVMPTVVMQNLQALLFDPEQTSGTLDYYFQHLLKSLKHIRIVPSFVDQTGRGGFRGAIEIDASDRLHGLIQKNFSLPEDTKFELEYLLSDEVSLRGIKDERGDLGGEVEMRWKF